MWDKPDPRVLRERLIAVVKTPRADINAGDTRDCQTTIEEVQAAEHDREAPVDTARTLAHAAPRGALRVYPGTHFDSYTDPSLRNRALADQLGFLHQHLHVSARPA